MLELDQIRIDGGTQSRVELNQETIAEYAQAFTAGATFPPVVVFFDGASYWLADGFHRYFGARDAGESAIDAEIRTGTQRDAVLYSWGANDKHGLPRSNADKRNIVTVILKDEQGRQWSDRDIAKRFGFSHPFVGNVRRSLETVTSEKPAERTYTTKHGTTAVMNTANIGVQQHREAAKARHEADIARGGHGSVLPPAPAVVEPEIEAPPEYTELDAAHDQISDLQAELVVARMGDIPEEEKQQAAGLIAELHAEIKTLNASLKAAYLSRDQLMEENAQMKRQMAMQRLEIDKLKSTK
jgi:hypothetical protein